MGPNIWQNVQIKQSKRVNHSSLYAHTQTLRSVSNLF